jgi:hypothetical protein
LLFYQKRSQNGKLIGNGYLGIGINIMQDNGELIDIENLIPLEDYKQILF